QIRTNRVALPADLVRFVGLHPVLGIPVLVGEDRDCPRPDFVSGPKRANGDFAPIGDQNLREHMKEQLLVSVVRSCTSEPKAPTKTVSERRIGRETWHPEKRGE